MYEFFKIEKKAVTTNSIYEQGSLYSIKAIHFKTYTILSENSIYVSFLTAYIQYKWKNDRRKSLKFC